MTAEAQSEKFARSISAYLQDAERARVLRPYQSDVFADYHRFFSAGYTRGFVELPTGSGKTVLFVELSKALLNESMDSHRPKILVVTPTKDLIYQTIGQSGDRGYGKFAPEIKVGSFFSDTPTSKKTDKALGESDVVITTYHSLRRMADLHEFRPILESEREEYLAELIKRWGPRLGPTLMGKTRPTGRTLLDKFDVFVLDEAHHIYGYETSRIIHSLPPEKVIIGYTATPDADDIRRLTTYLPHRIHTLEVKEAIGLGVWAPIVPLGLRSGIRIRGSDLYNDSGEFIDNRISYLAHEKGRNRLVLDTADILVHAGIGTIISCLAGGEAWHARYLAEELRAQGINATAVHKDVPAKERVDIYKKFERGEIDVLTFVGVLGEGWDSDRAKALINARPSRSLVFTKQRLGRITRPSGIAIAIDICDEYDSGNPIITVADILNKGDMSFGTILGEVENAGAIRQVLEQLRLATSTMDVLPSSYQSYKELLATLTAIDHGYAIRKDDLKGKFAYALSSSITPTHSGVTDEILTRLEDLRGETLDKKVARYGMSIRAIYNIEQAAKLLYSLPLVNPYRYYINEDRSKWMAAEGFMIRFSKKFPGITLDIVEEQLRAIGEQLSWVPARYQPSPEAKFTRYKVIKMYKEEAHTIDTLSQALSQYFADLAKVS